ncbi:uncharacterized protein HMPREF1541_05723 [Cyphellophora europaea CBS 101466]|uniref:Palmitoyltransferase n=1 Tax=Cyphellophora europaea (strain CBS 101466) TaxID=1220924 RepID=W2RSS7_CYPE1|nr:uncharacterized protein HMPREF1541_05723 [Cyphellophora europaea CBS 101466]ETN39497.1 hypothetical protein HMPREF1541_05723 [Cyphellophora europaea CBS 101466]
MGVLKTIIGAILTISLIVFVALFGRLPVFRRTPIAFLHKLLTKYIPSAFVWVDSYLTGRRLSRALFSTGHYLMYEKHPVVLIFFVVLQTLGEIAMVPRLWPTLTLFHKVLIPIMIALPHYYLYLTATTSSSIPLPSNLASPQPHPASPSPSTPPTTLDFGPAHAAAMRAYPYDYLLYHPGYFCSTCRAPKPPRSKHCSLCKACIQKQDHHCIWVNNCVGRANYAYFLLLLLAITALLVYGTLLGWSAMSLRLTSRFAPPELTRGSATTKTWASGTDWAKWFDRLAWALVVDVRVGATTLLCAMCTPLGAAFLAYHAYLLWAGMTTNEQGKWADWKEDVADQVVFRARIEELRRCVDGGFAVGKEAGAYPALPREVEVPSDEVDWPPSGVPAWVWRGRERGRGGVKWWYIRTRSGDQPTVKMSVEEAKARGLADGYPDGNGVKYGEVEVEDLRWHRVLSMRREMDNIYDLGFWGNLMEAIYHRGR